MRFAFPPYVPATKKMVKLNMALKLDAQVHAPFSAGGTAVSFPTEWGIF
jgi:hypothetical protein